MVTLEGVVKDGLIHPSEPIEQHEGETVKIIFEGRKNGVTPNTTGTEGGSLQGLIDLIDRLKTDMGIEDLAHNHDHYVHGTPKRGTSE